MGKLYFTGNGIIKHKGIPIKSYDFIDNEEMILEFIPFVEKKIKVIPYAVSIRIEDYELIIDSDLITIIKWGNDYELRFNNLIIDSYMPPEAMAQNTVYTPMGDITITVYKDTKTRIVAEGFNIFYIHTTIVDLTNAEIRMNQASDKIVVAITGNHNQSTYLLIMIITDKCKIIYEDTADEISYNKNNITLRKSLYDMKGRIINQTLAYNGTCYNEISHNYEYTYDHKYNGKLIPYALLEAIMANDIEDAKEYLDESLEVSALKEFFGDIIEIAEPKYKDYDENCIAVITKYEKIFLTTIYRFIVENNKITNIIEIDNPI